MENRNGLCVDIAIAPATGTAERDMALELIKHERRRGKRRMKTVGADKGYHATEFIKEPATPAREASHCREGQHFA